MTDLHPSAERWAQMFHDAYELAAPLFGYETREASRKPWSEVPEANRALMTAVAGHVGAVIEREAAAEAEALRAALEGLVRKMAAHSGSCCTFDDDGTVRVTRESCKCGPVERAAHEAIDWYGTTWKRGTRPTGSGATPAPAAPSEPGCSTCHGQDETCRECGGAPAPADPEPRP